jgi:hypothetical protein
MKASLYALATRWIHGAVPNGGVSGNVSRMFSVSVIVIPPEDDGGIVSSVWPRYVVRRGVRHTGL